MDSGFLILLMGKTFGRLGLPKDSQFEMSFWITLQEINVSHLGKRKIIFKYALTGGYVNFLEGSFLIWMNCFGNGKLTQQLWMILASLEWSATRWLHEIPNIVECSKASLFLYIYDSKPVLVTYGYIMMKKKLFK